MPTDWTVPQPFERVLASADPGHDGAVRVTGSTPEETLARLVLAQAQLMSGGGPIAPRGEGAIELPGSPDLAVTAVDVLREVCQRYWVAGQIACGVEVVDVSPSRVRLRVVYGNYDPEAHASGLNIKAVAYHGARFEPLDLGYVAEVVFEV